MAVAPAKVAQISLNSVLHAVAVQSIKLLKSADDEGRISAAHERAHARSR